MTEIMTSTPIVLSFNSLDTTGSGGISADIETLSSIGCHCTPVVTQLLTGNPDDIDGTQQTDTSLLIEQTRSILEDIKVNLISIGDVGNLSNADAICTILKDYPDIPVLFHPQFNLDHSISDTLLTLFFPHAYLSILSKEDMLMLTTGADTLAACAQELMEYGCDNVLITSDNSSTQVTNHWFSKHSSKQQFQRERLPFNFNGASSTLAAATSAYLAHGLSLAESIQQAQQFTFQALQKANRLGSIKYLPDRMHWCKK